jgi:hypothetical protein
MGTANVKAQQKRHPLDEFVIALPLVIKTFFMFFHQLAFIKKLYFHLVNIRNILERT